MRWEYKVFGIAMVLLLIVLFATPVWGYGFLSDREWAERMIKAIFLIMWVAGILSVIGFIGWILQ